jgi:hypothetical protein
LQLWQGFCQLGLAQRLLYHGVVQGQPLIAAYGIQTDDAS